MAKQKPFLAGPAQSAVSGYGFLSLPITDIEATAQTGDIITGIGVALGRKMDAVESDKQTLRAKGTFLTNYAEFEIGLAKDTDYTNYSNKLKDFVTIQENTVVENIKHRGARARAQSILENYKGQWAGRVQKASWMAESRAVSDEGFLQIKIGERLGGTGNFEDGEAHVKDGLGILTDNNIITEDKAEAMFLDSKDEMARLFKIREAANAEAAELASDDLFFNELTGMAEEDAYAELNEAEGLSSARRNALKARIAEHHRLRRDANTEQVAPLLRGNSVKDINTFLIDTLPGMNASETEKLGLETQLRNRMKSIAEGSDVITDRVWLEKNERLAANITTDSEDYWKQVNDWTELAYPKKPGAKPALHPDDLDALLKTADIRFDESQTNALSLAKSRANNLVTPRISLTERLSASLITLVASLGQEKGEKEFNKQFDKLLRQATEEVQEEQSLQEDLRDAHKLAINAYFDDPANRKKGGRKIAADLAVMYQEARAIRDRGVDAMRAERRLREAKLISSADIEAGRALATVKAGIDIALSQAELKARRTIPAKPIPRGAATGKLMPDPKRPGQPLVESTIDVQGNQVVQGVRMENGALIPIDGEFKDNNGKIWIFKGLKADGKLDWKEK